MENDISGLTAMYPITGLREDTAYIYVCVTAQIEGRRNDDIFLLHLNDATFGYESNIVTYDTSNQRDYWRPAAGTVSATKGFAIGYVGFGTVNQTLGAAAVMAELTIGIAPLRPRLASGTSYTETDKLEDKPHNQRYLSRIGGQYRNVGGTITGVRFSMLNNTPFSITSARIATL
jgi:hypothetical protein